MSKVKTLHQWLTGSDYRACHHCIWGSGASGEARECMSMDVTGQAKPIKVTVARSKDGACGPEARHLHIASWEPLKREMGALDGFAPKTQPVIERRRYMLDQKSRAAGEKPEPDSDFDL